MATTHIKTEKLVETLRELAPKCVVVGHGLAMIKAADTIERLWGEREVASHARDLNQARARKAEAECERLSGYQASLVLTVKHYLPPDYGTPAPEHRHSFLVHTLNRLGGISRDYGAIAKALEESRREVAGLSSATIPTMTDDRIRELVASIHNRCYTEDRGSHFDQEEAALFIREALAEIRK